MEGDPTVRESRSYSDGSKKSVLLAELLAWNRKIQGMRRIIVCEPDREAEVREAVAALGLLGGLYEVRAHASCPEGQVLILPKEYEVAPPPPPRPVPAAYMLPPVLAPSAFVKITGV